LLVALLDTTEHNIRKIAATWKKQNVDFDKINQLAADELAEWLSDNFDTE